VKQLAIEQGLITKEQADKVFDFRKMTEPGETGGGLDPVSMASCFTLAFFASRFLDPASRPGRTR